jgi:acyl-coenzyme A synthetase/AMP-(fatty) acid ligase
MDDPERIVLHTKTINYTSRNIAEASIAFKINLIERGVTESSIIGLRTTNYYYSIISILAISLVGCRWALVTETSFKQEHFAFTHYLDFGDRGATAGLNIIHVNESWFAPIKASTYRNHVVKRAHDGWMIAQSSGTTGDFKFMEITNSIIVSRIKYATPFADIENPKSLILFRSLTIVWVLYTLSTLNRSGIIVESQLEKDIIYRNVNFITGSPLHIYQLIQSLSNNIHIEATVSVVGAPVSGKLIQLLHKRFKTITQRYGTTETGIIAHGEILPNQTNSGRIGSIIDGVKIEFVTPELIQNQKSDKWGLIKIQSPWSIHSYLQANNKNPQEQRWFTPGDIAYLDCDGSLIIAGRISEIINVAGTKINTLRIESALEMVEGVHKVAVFSDHDASLIDHLSVAVVPVHMDNFDAVCESIIKRLGNIYRGQLGKIQIYCVPTLPITETGKIARGKLAEYVYKNNVRLIK